MNSLHSISKPDQAKADVVFVHGLGGDPFKTWQHDSEKPDNCWPHWLSSQRDQVGVHCLGYDASPHRWLGESMPLGDTAEASIGTLIAAGIGDRPLIMVGHSLGGLVIKQILRKVQDRKVIQKWEKLGASTKVVIFLGTPHRGAKLATILARLGQYFGMSPAPTIDDLRRHSELLVDLNDWYGANAHEMGIETHCFYETVGTHGMFLPRGVVIVDKGSGDIDLPNIPSYPIAVDHIAICKPTVQSDARCGYLLKLIDELLKNSISDDGSLPTKSVASLHTLPGPNPDFVGRGSDMRAIREALRGGGAAIAALEGMGGIGKTTLGVEVANVLQEEGVFPGGVVFLDLEGFSASGQTLAPEAALARLIRAIVGSERKLPDDLAGLQQAWRQVVEGREMLLFLDNARDENQIRPLLPGLSSCRVLTTSRHRLDLPGILPLELGLLAADEAIALALKLGNRWQEGRLSEAQATRLVTLCGRHPLAIEITAAALGKGRLLDVETHLEKLALVGRSALKMEQVKAKLRTGLDLLEPELRLKWRQLAVFEGDFAADAVASVWAVEAAEEDLTELEQRSLLAIDGHGRLRLHDVLRAVALEEISEEELAIAGESHARWYKTVFDQAGNLYWSDEYLKGLELYDLEQHQISAGQRWAAEHFDCSDELARLAAEYPYEGAYILHLRVTPKERIRWFETQAEASRLVGDHLRESGAIGGLGGAYAALGDIRRAIEFHQLRLTMSRDRRDERGEGIALGYLGFAYSCLGETKRAISLFEESLDIARKVGNRACEAFVLNCLGHDHAVAGRNIQAIELLKDCLGLARTIGDRQREVGALSYLGTAHRNMGNATRAIEVHQEQLDLAREIGDRMGEGAALGKLGVIHLDLGQIEKAIEFHKQHLSIAIEVDNRLAEGRALSNLANAYIALGENNHAIELLERSLKIARDVGHRRGEGKACWLGAQAFERIGNRETAIAWAQNAKVILEATEDSTLEDVRAALADWSSKDEEGQRMAANEGAQ